MEASSRLAVVTGATGGVGAALSRRLATMGFDLLVSGRDRGRLESLAAELSGPESRVRVDYGAFTTPADVHRIAEMGEGLGRPTCLVNAAGMFGPIGYPESTTPEQWEAVMALNATCPIALAGRLLPAMIDGGFGRVVMVSSAHTLYPADGLTSPYLASKTALNEATRGLAAGLDGFDVAAVLVHPGDLKTAMWADIDTQLGQLGPLDRLGIEASALRGWAQMVGETGGDDPELAADLLEEIISRDASWSNGRFLFAGTSGDRHPDP